jgi:pyruvate dehydrogenase E2 component (dihydrolipoamide acetyltransferase)
MKNSSIHKQLIDRQPISHHRQLIASRMSESARQCPVVTLTTDADVTEIANRRESMKLATDGCPVPSYNSLFAVVVSMALTEHPEINASFDGDAILRWKSVNLGIAVDTPSGLVVPVAHNLESKEFDQIILELDALLNRASMGRALPDELTGGTFTITNLGNFGVDAFTPLLNPPESAILGIGRISQKCVVKEEKMIIRNMITLSLTFDHRIIDGVPAARFLQCITKLLEQSEAWWL